MVEFPVEGDGGIPGGLAVGKESKGGETGSGFSTFVTDQPVVFLSA